MNDIEAEDQRNTQPGFLHGNLLEFVDHFRILHHEGSHLSFADIVLMVILLRTGHDLSEFFLGNAPVRHHLDELLERHVKASHDRR